MLYEHKAVFGTTLMQEAVQDIKIDMMCTVEESEVQEQLLQNCYLKNYQSLTELWHRLGFGEQ